MIPALWTATVRPFSTGNMKVVAEVGGQTQALGTVEPKQQASFMVQAPPGAQFKITASDSTNQHRVQATLMGMTGTALHFVIR